ncbi:MAG: Snf7 family protein [Candidatus Methanomethylicus sp.]|nr:Snf7 family protein [Candidatus Methanomethylicus sp.]
MDFLKRWESRKEIKKSKSPLKPQLEEAIRIVMQQIQMLDIKSARIKEYDRGLFDQVVHFYSKRDMTRAKIYATELTEVRKLAKMIATTRLALEQISVRLATVKEYGDVAANVAPALEAINSIYGGMTQVVPEADQSVYKLNDLLQGVMVEATQYTGRPMDVAYASEESNSILNEASSIAEEQLSKMLPKIPELERKRELLGI